MSLAAAALALVSLPALADPADINAAARGVVRVVLIEHDGEQLVPITHGTGFAVTPERIITNAHVVREARMDPSLSIGIIPSDGEDSVYALLVATSSRNDLAILTTTAPMNLPPLTISSNPTGDIGPVTAVGYPMNVDRAQGLSFADIFRAQPPVMSTGFLSGRRPTRDFDSLLHTAPIARGNSGGPLLDECGRVVGVNSFGTESGSADAEFFFAVSTRELLPFLRANDITPQISTLPCRSLAELDSEERARADRAQLAAMARATAADEAQAQRRAEALRLAEFSVMADRENGMALAGLLLILALGASGFAFFAHERGGRRAVAIAGGVAGLAVAGAAVAWLSRPGFAHVEERAEDSLRRESATASPEPAGEPLAGPLACMLDLQRSRATSAVTERLDFTWSAGGCVNERTQYGLADGAWTRILIPDEEAAVSVNRFDPLSGELRVERYLLSREGMTLARNARAQYDSPECGADAEATGLFGARQQVTEALLPGRPNERLIYRCTGAP